MSDVLDDFLKRQQGVVLVNLWEEYADACSLMEKVMKQLEKVVGERLHILRLPMSENRKWAEHYRVRGTPSVLVFQDGKLIARFRGKMEYKEVVNKLRQLGLMI